jgi:uncharacterized membrane protein
MPQPSQQHGPTDMQMDSAIANMLRFGISLAGTLMILGGWFYLQHPTMQPADYAHFHGTSIDLHNLGKVLTGKRLADSTSVLELGIVLLIATPVARVALCVVDFARQRDRLYVVISFGVLLVLLYSLFRGGR